MDVLQGKLFGNMIDEEKETILGFLPECRNALRKIWSQGHVDKKYKNRKELLNMYGDNVKEIIKLLENKLNEAYLDSIKDVAESIDEKLDESYMRGFEDGQKQKEYDLIQDGKLEEKYKKGYEQGVKDERKRIYGLIDAFADSQKEESMKLDNTPVYVKAYPDNKVIPDNKVTLGEATEEFIKMQLQQREEEDPRMILCQH